MIYGITMILREDAQILTAKQVYTTKGIASVGKSAEIPQQSAGKHPIKNTLIKNTLSKTLAPTEERIASQTRSYRRKDRESNSLLQKKVR